MEEAGVKELVFSFEETVSEEITPFSDDAAAEDACCSSGGSGGVETTCPARAQPVANMLTATTRLHANITKFFLFKIIATLSDLLDFPDLPTTALQAASMTRPAIISVILYTPVQDLNSEFLLPKKDFPLTKH